MLTTGHKLYAELFQITYVSTDELPWIGAELEWVNTKNRSPYEDFGGNPLTSIVLLHFSL